MRALRTSNERVRFLTRAALLVAGLSTYLISPEDVVWRFIKAAPHARVLEHLCFGTAAAALGLALFLKMKAEADKTNQRVPHPSRIRAAVADLLQSIGIGSLLPLPGFLLLVFGELGASLLLEGSPRALPVPQAGLDASGTRSLPQAFRRRSALLKHLGLCCSFGAMVVFSITLIDRVADVLFAATALVSIATSLRPGSSDPSPGKL